MGWEQGIRDLTKEEEALIRDYLISCFGDEKAASAEYYLKKILANDYLKMDFLEFAQKNQKLSICGIQQYVLTD